MTDTSQAPRRDATMMRLMDAAHAHFARHGYAAARLRDIAAEADANVALVSRYFGGKRGLFVAVMQREVAGKQTGTLPYPPQDTLRDEVRLWLTNRIEADRAARGILRMMVMEVLTRPEIREDMLAAITDEYESNIGRRLYALQAAGRLHPDADVTEILRIMLLFAFSCAFMEGELMAIDPEDTKTLATPFAEALDARFGAGAKV